MHRYPNYTYLSLTTREPDTIMKKVYIQELLTSGRVETLLGEPLRPERTHVYLCGNPAMIGVQAGAVSFEDRRELSALLRYLSNTRGGRGVTAVLGLPADTVTAWEHDSTQGTGASPGDRIAALAMRHLGLSYVNRWEPGAREQTFWANLAQPRALDVSGFQLVRVFSYPGAAGWIGTESDSLPLAPEDSSGAP